MAGQWKEVVRLRFKGNRFRDHAFDLSALAELSQFQKIVAETAKSLWRTEHPNRDRLPRHFEERIRLCLRKIEEGSAVAPLEVFIEEPKQRELWEQEPEEVNQAVQLAYNVYEAVDRDAPLPQGFPKNLVSEYAKWGHTLENDEEIEIETPSKESVRISTQHRDRLSKFIEVSYNDLAEVSGEVFSADIRNRRFRMWLDNEMAVEVSFNEEQEETITTALKEHKVVRLHVKGQGEYSPEGQLQRFVTVDSMETKAVEVVEYNPQAPAIEDVLSAIAAEVPRDEWNKLPSDLTDDLDHYLYGTPR